MSANLLQELKTGDEQAYKRLFRVYYANLVVYASTILKDREVAEDIVQELFINFWYEKKYENISSELERYLFRSTRNNCINYIRNERRHNDKLVRMIVNEKEECKVDLEEMEEREELYRAMNRLPEQCRRIFNLCHRNFDRAHLGSYGARFSFIGNDHYLLQLRVSLHADIQQCIL